MLTLLGRKTGRFCDNIGRRDFLRIGTLGAGALTLGGLLRLRAQGAATSRSKAVIMVYLNGGPSHIDMYDMKPDAPVEYRGEFQPIRTNVPGIDICELMPLQAKMADKLAIVRNMKFHQDQHKPHELMTGYSDTKDFPFSTRPGIGSVVSRLRADAGQLGELPPYVALDGYSFPAYLGAAHVPFTVTAGQPVRNLQLPYGISSERLTERKALLHSLDTLRRELDDSHGSMKATEAFQAQAMEIISGPKARKALDLNQEPESVRKRYGSNTQLLLALRLAEAGVPLTTVSVHGNWDTHDKNFATLRELLPQLDQGVSALVGDLHERGLDKDVAIVVWGEIGRTPRTNSPGAGKVPGRDHWPQAGFALLAGGGFRMGQVIGGTDHRAGSPKGNAYTPQNVLATLYQVLGIDPSRTLPDHNGRPMYLLDERDVIKELF
jgi:uncharacterized protein (DUF1501 family)